jgi:uncharacterized membrane protein YphA (DoxX/SURF4 family)
MKRRPWKATWQETDRRVRDHLGRIGFPMLRWTLALVFIWFGLLKPLDASPANDLVKRTIYWLPPEVFLPLLGWWEVAIGLCLLWSPLVRIGVLLLFLQMPGTFLPLFLLPEVCFDRPPFGLTMEGQYIVKNLVLIAAAIVVGSHPPPLGLAAKSPRNPDNSRGPAPMSAP